jgi:hypothetical protein
MQCLPTQSLQVPSNTLGPTPISSASSFPNRRPFLWDIKSRKRPNYSKGGSKRKKLPTWTHTFVCLAKRETTSVPDSQERAALILSGLGEKKIQLDEYSEWPEIYEELMFQYPKLKELGGFELLRVGEGGGKRLQTIACPPKDYTVMYLRAVVHHATVYIRPLQRDISLEVESPQPVSENVCIIIMIHVIVLQSLSVGPLEKCLLCGDMVSVTALREHMVECER